MIAAETAAAKSVNLWGALGCAVAYSAALLATHLNGERLNLDHGYPLRLISPNRPGVLNTKWLTGVEVT